MSNYPIMRSAGTEGPVGVLVGIERGLSLLPRLAKGL